MTPTQPDTIQLEVQYIARRSRLTVFLRAILAIPQVIVVFFLGLASSVVTVIGWFAALALGRLPTGIAKFNAGVLAWGTRVYAYSYFLVDRYPPFDWTAGEDYPVRLRVAPGRLNRLTVLFRFILALPAALLGYAATAGMVVTSVVVWLILVIGGRMPKALFEALVAVQRYWTRVQGYVLLLTDSYPRGLFNEPLALGGQAPADAGDPFDPTAAFEAAQPSISPARATAWRESPSPRSSTGKTLVALFIIVGALALAAQWANTTVKFKVSTSQAKQELVTPTAANGSEVFSAPGVAVQFRFPAASQPGHGRQPRHREAQRVERQHRQLVARIASHTISAPSASAISKPARSRPGETDALRV